LRAVSLALFLALSTNAARADSLLEALAQAYANNPAISSALLSVKIAAEDIALRQSGQRPNVGLSASSGYNYTVAGGTTTQAQSSSFSLTYTQRLFDNLVTRSQIDQAAAFADVATEGLRNSEQNVLLAAATAYLDVARDTRLSALRADNMSFLQAQVKSARDRLEIGEGTRIDLSQAEARHAQSIASYRSAVSSLQASQASYQRWIGTKPSNVASGFSFGSILPASVDAAMNSAKINHPANLSARAQIAAAQFGTDAALRAFGPTLDLVGSVGLATGTGMPAAATGSLRFTLNIPIYAGGRLGASARQANLRQIQTELDALVTAGQVQESVVAAWTGMQTARSQIAAAKLGVTAAKDALAGMIEERNVGQRTTLDVLNARAELTLTQETLILAERGRIVAGFSLIAAAGNLNAAALRLPVQIRSADGYRANVADIWAELRDLTD